MQKTEKLYYSDTKMLTAEAVVLDCAECNGKYEVVLDKTCFFPEGGGQGADFGTMNGAYVSDVREHDDVLYHVTDKKFEKGEAVKLQVDAKRRADHCAQHTGEHMISGLAKTLFDAHNVGFHMADTYSTLDFDVFLDDEQLHTLEREVNRAVRENRRIYYDFVDAEKLSSLTLRKKTDGIEQRADTFRIVYIDGVDSCTCCGSHCETTGEVGIVKFNSWQKYKSGIRIWFLCGERAYDDFVKKQDITDTLAKRFSTTQDEILPCIIKQGNELSEQKIRLKQKIQAFCELRAEKLLETAPIFGGVQVAVVCDEDMDAFEMKTLIDKLTEKGKVIAVLFSYAGGECMYAIGCTDGAEPNAQELSKTVNALIGGKGGGRSAFAQGKGKAQSYAVMKETAEQLGTYLGRLLDN